jgi:hypothetical protein
MISKANTRSILRAAILFGMGLLTAVAWAQTQPAAPMKAAAPPASLGAYNYLYWAGLTCGAGASNSTAATKPTAQCGGTFSLLPFFNLEAGVMGPQAKRSAVSGYLSTNAWAPLVPFKHLANKHGIPMVVGGYTRMFETGHALDYGLAFAHPIDSSHSIQFEVRDYWAFANPSQHNVVFRIAWLVGLPD